MTVHDEFLELISASIDFDLTEDERGRLNLHLSQCAECRRAGAEIRSIAAEVAGAPRPRLSATRSEAILAGALRRPASRPRWGLLAVAAMLALGGGALAALGLFDDDPAPSVPPSPSPIAEVSAPPSVAPSESPSAPPVGPGASSPAGSPTPAGTPRPAGVTLPVPWSADTGGVRVAEHTDGSVWVSLDAGDRRTVLALLDADGVPSPGWPIEVPFAGDCVPFAVPDQSVRLVCAYSEADEGCEEACGEDRVFAWDARARALPGWPASLDRGGDSILDRHGARVLGTDLVLARFTPDPEPEDEADLTGVSQIIRITADGAVRPGAEVTTAQWCCTVGPDGRAYVRNAVRAEDGTQTTILTAFDEAGVVAGWPIELPGDVSMPAFGPDGLLYLAAWVGIGESSLVVRHADGSAVTEMPDAPIAGSVTWDPGWFAPLRPGVDEAGRAFVLLDDRLLAFDAALTPITGWPYEPSTSLAVVGECPPGDTGCQPYVVPPQVDRSGILYLLEASEASDAGRVTALNRDGTVRTGWPVTLQRPGSSFESVTLGPTGLAYAVAVEPEAGDARSITILAIARDSTVLWTRTVSEP